MAEVMTVAPQTYDLLVRLLPTLEECPRDRAQILRRANIELENNNDNNLRSGRAPTVGQLRWTGCLMYAILYVAASLHGMSTMPRLRPSADVRPVTEFRANAAALLDQVQKTKRPMILTQHGRSAAVLLDVAVYEDLLDKVALLRDVRTGEKQVAAGEGAAHGAVAKRLRARIAK